MGIQVKLLTQCCPITVVFLLSLPTWEILFDTNADISKKDLFKSAVTNIPVLIKPNIPIPAITKYGNDCGNLSCSDHRRKRDSQLLSVTINIAAANARAGTISMK